MPTSPLDEKPQWCDLHRGSCAEINLLRRDMGNWVHICTQCARTLQRFGMTKAGPVVGKHPTLQLTGVTPVDPTLKRSPYLVTLEREYVIAMRAIGYKILEDDSDYGDLFEGEDSEV